MTLHILPRFEDLEIIFETQPVLLDHNVPWQYNTLTYYFQQNDGLLTCEITPSYETVRIHWEQNSTEILNLQLTGVQFLQVERERGRDALVLKFDEDQPIERLQLQLRPNLCLYGSINTIDSR